MLPSYINEGAPCPSSQKASVDSKQASNIINYGSPSSTISPPPPCHMKEDSSLYSSVAQSGPPITPSTGLPSVPRQNNPFLSQCRIVPSGDMQTSDEGQISMSLRKKDKLSATTETTPMQANHATPGQYTSKLPGK